MLRAEKLMTRDVITAQPESSLLMAMKILVDKGISGLPVTDLDMNILGVITEKDFLRLMISDVITKNEIVKNYMSTDVKFFGPNDNVVTICEFFMNNNFRRVPIVDNGKLVGVISRRDIIRLIITSADGA